MLKSCFFGGTGEQQAVGLNEVGVVGVMKKIRGIANEYGCRCSQEDIWEEMRQ